MSNPAPKSLAYEIIGASVKKIKSVASSKKYAKLTEECKRLHDLLNSLQQGHPMPATFNAPSTPATPVSARQENHADAVELSTNRATTEGAETSSVHEAGQQGGSEGGDVIPSETSAAPGSEHRNTEQPLPGQQTAIDSLQEETSENDVANTVTAPTPIEGSDAGSEAGREIPKLSLSALSTPRSALGGARSPKASPKSPGTPRTKEALGNDLCLAVVNVMRLAVETNKPAVVEAALDCLQKLITHRLLQGAVTAINMDKPAGKESGSPMKTPGTPDPFASTPQAQAVELMCRCDNIPDEAVELQVLRGLLSACTSATFTMHGQALLLAVRTCYNIYLMSRSEVNQTTAKASLTQMLNVVFQRMERNSTVVQVKPIVVSDVLGLPKPGTGDSSSVAVTVQSFVNTVVATTAYIATGQPDTDELRSSVAGAFEGRLAGQMANTSDSDDEREHFTLGRSPSTSSQYPDSISGSPVKGDTPRVGVLQRDAFLVFRALCKLSIRTSDSATVADPTAVRGKVLALELLKVLLENSGKVFMTSEKFLSAIRQHLCLSLLKNSASSVPQALQLSCSIFVSLLSKFRQALKAEIGVFFPMIILKAIEPVSSSPASSNASTSTAAQSPAHRAVVLRCLREVCSDGQLLVDLFVNYDCDIEGSNLFERVVTGLVKLAQTSNLAENAGGPNQQEQFLRQEGLQCLVNMMKALLVWYKKASGLDDGASDTNSGTHPAASTVASSAEEPATAAAAAASGGGPAGASPVGAGMRRDSISPTVSTLKLEGAGKPQEEEGGEALSNKRAYKQKFQEGISLFNKKPRKGIQALQAEGMVGERPEEVAVFLAKTEGLNKTMIGDYLGEREDFCLKVMHAYVDAMEFTDMEFDEAIRNFLNGFRLPGEAQKIDRLMEKFAERYVKCNPASFKSADVAYVLAYSVIMLNTDAHNPQVKTKMSKEDFLKNNRGVNDGADLPEEFLMFMYDRITNNEIKMKEDVGSAQSAAAASAAAAAADNPAALAAKNFVNTLLSLMGANKERASAEPSDEAIKRTLEYLHQKAKSLNFFSATEGDTVKPILDFIWAPLLGALSVQFEEYTDPRLIRICLQGFEASVCLTAHLGMGELRDVFLMALCNFTHLHSPSTMRIKNALAFRSLLAVAQQVGDHLGDKWIHVLRCISRWQLLQQVVSGAPSDAVVFPMQHPGGHDKGFRAAADALQKKFKNMASVVKGEMVDEQRSSVDSLTMNETTIKKALASSQHDRDNKDGGIPEEVINSVPMVEIDRVFTGSSELDSEAIVEFVKALKSISLDELKVAQAPRVFSLCTIVQVAHFNMTRIRLVWSRIWSVLSDYFITVGCHSNLSVAMFAVDSLRQLAMKFLERDELANYTFQNDFLRPFVVVMRQSQAVEIRELIIRCLSQMVLARVNNVKSGWKSMFMVYTTAAADRDPTIVRLAFDTIEKIVREHFNHITETETTTFTDCVNCLIAFTNNPHSLDVALNSIAFLRFCAMRLAEGAIGDVDDVSEDARPAVYAAAATAKPTRISAIDRNAIEGAVAGSIASSPSAHEVALRALADFGASASSSPKSAAGATPKASGLSPRASGSPRVGSPRTGEGGAMKFTDREEHVYFWFPLLAGLSELTFDPRQEIRNGALEVLFDTLKYHGASFAAPFWARIYDSVLLPIFDHVRAEVTDTTTFTSEKRRAQEDAWLFETCTKCLQHLVDLYVQFHYVVGYLLPRLADLLTGFMRRSHQSLASVGVAGYVRLMNNAGGLFTSDQWDEVFGMLVTVVEETWPDAEEVATPPGRQPGEESTPGASRPYTLREGVGARRLAKFRCKANIQLMLVQACGEIYSCQHENMTPSATGYLLDILERISAYARDSNTNMGLRGKLSAQQAQDRVTEDKQIPDPPLLRLETEASHTYLSLLLHITMVHQEPILLQQANIESRLGTLCSKVLTRFCNATPPTPIYSAAKTPPATPPKPSPNQSPRPGASPRTPQEISIHVRATPGLPITMASPAAELAQLAPLVVSVLRALAAFPDAAFRVRLKELFPLLSQLIKCELAPAEVHQALSDLFLKRVGPLLQPAMA